MAKIQSKLPKISTLDYDELTIKWADDVELDVDNDDLETISSEEENASELDSEQRARAKVTQEIWSDEEIWKSLQSMSRSDELLQDINSEIIDKLTSRTQDFRTIAVLATWLGKNTILREILKNGGSSDYRDDQGRSLLHLAACANNQEALSLLIDYGMNVDVWDSKRRVTPLHCAASKGNLSLLKFLIKNGADVNAGLNTKSPLHYAVQSLAVDCVRELLENDAVPSTTKVFSETPLHVAASLGSSEITGLLLKYGAAVNIQCGKDKMTPLHLAAEDGDLNCVRLLLDADADVTVQNHKKQTPLHLAALSQCSETLELLLSKGADPNVGDADGRTPLHGAIAKVSRSCDCVRILLNFGANANKADAFGYTPLHIAALNEFSQCVMLLINNGGDVTLRTKGGISVLNFITRKTPDVIPQYIEKFDSSIKLNDHEIGDVDCELKLDFRILVPTMGNKETELLLNFIEVGYREILKHPLCETFLFLKWRRIRKYFLFSLFYHALYVLLFSFYVIGNITFAGYVLMSLNVVMMGKELFQIAHNWLVYIKQWENWLQWLIIISVFCCVPHMSATNEYDMTHNIAAIGIFLAWLELMMIVGRFPIFGLYIQMFTTVSVNFLNFMAAYFCLLMAFALSFRIIFGRYKSFRDLKWILLKVIVMMSGELEYEDIYYDEETKIDYNWTAHVMFLGFVVLVTIILTNLMVGLAVSDIQGLQQSAGLDRLVRQAELVAHLESMLFSKLLTCIPHKLIKFFHQQALLLKSRYHWALYIKPNDPREEKIPKDLIRNIYKLVSERKEKPRSKRMKNRYYKFQVSDYVSPPLSRLSSYSSNFLNDYKSPQMLKVHLDEMSKEFQTFSKVFKQKLELLSCQFPNK